MPFAQMINDRILRRVDLRLTSATAWEERNIEQRCRESLATSFIAQERILELAGLLVPHRATGYSKIRLGGPNDGGYVCLNDFDKIAMAFSFGIGDDVSWDVDIADRDILVHQFDHTIKSPTISHRNFQFNQKRVAPIKSAPNEESISSLWSQYLQNTQESVILKMDVEDDEWDILFETPSHVLSSFAQIICEFHSFSSIPNQKWYERAYTVLKKLDLHFAVVHLHGNNALPWVNVGGVPFPELLEVTYASRMRYSFGPSEELFPTPLDAPNIPEKPDLYLGRFVLSSPRRERVVVDQRSLIAMMDK
jgi:hypothetical protein